MHISITTDLRGSLWRAFLTVSLKWCSYGLLVDPDDLLSGGAREVWLGLRPFIVDVSQRLEWPGTRLHHRINKGPQVYSFRLNSDSIEVLLRWSDGLFDWIAPHLPEDLALLRGDRSVFMGSISHEQDAFLNVSSQEYMQLLEQVPDIDALLRTDG